MANGKQVMAAIRAGDWDKTLGDLYALEGHKQAILQARTRAIGVVEGFINAFGDDGEMTLFSAPGRTELGGNHTDHQQGQVLCGSVNLDILAAAAANNRQVIRVLSEGYPALEVDLHNLMPQNEEGTSAALVRGLARVVSQLGYGPVGIDVYMTSQVLSGSGLSSSAAYEMLMANILNHFCCRGRLTSIQMAQGAQFAENTYFGKPSGLMDQLGCGIGGAIFIDFQNLDVPHVQPIHYDFRQSGHCLCIVDTRSDHADLTHDYAAIPKEMGMIAAYFGKQVLREVDENDFQNALPTLRNQCGDRPVLRAMHFYAENRRVHQEAVALAAGDFDGFLRLVNASGRSSEALLQNIYATSQPQTQAVSIALALGRQLLDGAGAIRVHGGGFAGTIQAFVPESLLENFRRTMEVVLGEGCCHILRIRPQGSCQVAP